MTTPSANAFEQGSFGHLPERGISAEKKDVYSKRMKTCLVAKISLTSPSQCESVL